MDDDAEVVSAAAEAPQAEAPPEPVGSNDVPEAAAAEVEPLSPIEATKAALGLTEEADAASDQKPADPATAETPKGPELPPEQAQWRAAAEEVQAFNAYLSERGLKGDDLRMGVDLIAAIKTGDAQKALEMLAPLYEQLQTRAGQVLPPDLQEAVANGLVTEDYARQLAERLAGGQTAEQRLAAERQQREQAEAERFQTSMIDTASSWEKALAGRDPEYQKRAELVHDAAHRLATQNPPKTPADLIKLLDDADKRVKALMPKPQRPATVASPQPSRAGISPVRPKTPLEATRLALQEGA